MMQLLYGNDGKNYVTIAKSAELTPVQEEELLKGYLGYDFVKNTAQYSSISSQPVSFTYVTTDLSGSLPKEMILLSKNARMSNYQTPSYYAHFQLMDMEESLYGEDFLSFLKRTFIKDRDLNDYIGGTLDNFQSTVDESVILNCNAIEQEKLIAIVASVLSVADTLSKKVSIILDVTGDAYNARALEVIATIYTYLPYNIRRSVGVSTYAGEDSMISNRIKVQLYTRDMAEKREEGIIDLLNMNPQEIMRRLPQSIVELAKDFVESDVAVREGWFQAFISVFQLKKVTVEEHTAFFKSIRKWQEEDLESIMDEIAVHAYKEMQKPQKSMVFQIFQNTMKKRFFEEGYLERFHEIIEELLKNQMQMEFDNRLKAYIMLGEAVSVLTFQQDTFNQWFKVRYINVARREIKDDNQKLLQVLDKFSMKIKEMNYGAEKFAEIKKGMQEQLKNEIEVVQNQINKEVDEENKRIYKVLQQQEIVPYYNIIECIYTEIRYDENKDTFQQLLSEKIQNYLSNIVYFKSYSNYCAIMKFIDFCKKMLDEKNHQTIVKIVEEKGEAVKIMEKCKMIQWNNWNDILTTYQNIAQMDTVSYGKEDIVVPNYELEIDSNRYSFDSKRLKILIQFLVTPKYNALEARKIFRENQYLLYSLKDINIFDERHFAFLMEFASYINIQPQAAYQEQILDYYINNSNILSEEELKSQIDYLDTRILERLKNKLDLYAKININQFRRVLQNKIPQNNPSTIIEQDSEQIKLPVVAFSSSILPAILFMAASFITALLSAPLTVLAALTFFCILCGGILWAVANLLLKKDIDGWFFGSTIGFGLSVPAIWIAYAITHFIL